MVTRRIRPAGVAVLALAAASIALPSGCQDQVPKEINRPPAEKDDPPPAFTGLELQFTDAPHEKSEMLIDGKAQPLKASGGKMTIPLPPGSHAVAFQLGGKQVFHEVVAIKNQGRTVLKVPNFTSGSATLEILIPRMSETEQWNNLDLVIDGASATYPVASTGNPYVGPGAAGKHTIVFRKNGLEILSEEIEVKKDGKTTFDAGKIEQLVAIGVKIKNSATLSPGVDAQVELDGAFHVRWPLKGDTCEFAVGVSAKPRVIQVRTTKPNNLIIATFRVKAAPKEPLTLFINK